MRFPATSRPRQPGPGEQYTLDPRVSAYPEHRGTTSDRIAATPALVIIHRSCARYAWGAQSIMAERPGFEPGVPVSQDNRLAGDCLQPARPPLHIPNIARIPPPPSPLNRWRREWDSNPRSRSARDNGFQDRRLQPLGHPSVGRAAENSPSAALPSSRHPAGGTSPPQSPDRRAPCIRTLLSGPLFSSRRRSVKL